MLPEISLHVLDTAENSVRAGAALVEIEVEVSTSRDSLRVMIKDNGSGIGKKSNRSFFYNPYNAKSRTWSSIFQTSGGNIRGTF